MNTKDIPCTMLDKRILAILYLTLTSKLEAASTDAWQGKFLTMYYRNSPPCYIVLLEASKSTMPFNVSYVSVSGNYDLTNIWNPGNKFATCVSVVITESQTLSDLEEIVGSTSGHFGYKEIISFEPLTLRPQNEDFTYISVGKTKSKPSKLNTNSSIQICNIYSLYQSRYFVLVVKSLKHCGVFQTGA